MALIADVFDVIQREAATGDVIEKYNSSRRRY